MSVQVEKLDGSKAKLTIEVPAEEFVAAMQQAYTKNKSKFNLQGFRKGHAPQAIIEKMYGPAVFYEDAANILISDAYAKAYEEADVEIVSRPEIDVTQIEKGKSFIFTATVATKPEVTLGDYKGVEVYKSNADVTDDEITAELSKKQEENSRLITVERPIQTGDIAVIDFEGFVDGVAFNGGKGTDYELGIGTHSFIDTFEDQLIGASTGDDVEVNVTFPEEYGEASLAGKPALFKVTVKNVKVKELPELDDEFASEISDFETLDEYKEDLKKTIAERKEKQAESAKQNQAVDKAVANATMEIADLMIDDEADRMVDEMAQNMQQQGISMEMYLRYTGMTKEQLTEQTKPRATERIKSRLVLEAIANAENIEATDDDVNKEIERMASTYKMEVETVKNYLGEAGAENIKKDMRLQKAAEFLAANAVEVDAPAEEKTEE